MAIHIVFPNINLRHLPNEMPMDLVRTFTDLFYETASEMLPSVAIHMANSHRHAMVTNRATDGSLSTLSIQMSSLDIEEVFIRIRELVQGAEENPFHIFHNFFFIYNAMNLKTRYHTLRSQVFHS